MISLTMLTSAAPSFAALKVGDQAPDFQAKASMAGKELNFTLSAGLKKGPVVLYFYPAAFTPGCTLEAHAFAEAVDEFKALGASVIGVSHDEIAKLNQFSTSECRGKFAVVADPDRRIMQAYDSVLPSNPMLANRTSYVITPDGRIIYSFTDMKPDLHVANALSALRTWKAQSAKSSR
jgi:peroxiredoxin